MFWMFTGTAILNSDENEKISILNIVNISLIPEPEKTITKLVIPKLSDFAKKTKDSLCINLKMCILKMINPFINTSPVRCTILSYMSTKITKICITNDKISSRGAFPVFLRHVEKNGFLSSDQAYLKFKRT
ncbi:MAG: hypothetical protein R6U58_02300 [Bacteroidales bacterium]